MTTILQEFQELLSMTQSHIFNEYNSKDLLMTDPETHVFYQQFYQGLGKPQPKPIQPQPPQRIASPPIKQYTPPPPKVPTTPPPPKRQHLPPKKETVSETKPSNTTTQPASSNESPHFLTLDPITEVKESNFADIKKDVAELFPELKIIDQPPDDRAAKKVNQQWKKGPILPEVILLTFNETPEQTEFLLKVVNAINEHLAPAQMFSAYTIDKQRKWENMLKIEGLRLVIAPDYGIYSLPNLKKYYRESTVHAERTLAGIPVLLLTDVGLYIKQPSLKPALWKALCAILKDGS